MKTKQLSKVDVGYELPKSETDLKKISLDYMDKYRPHTTTKHYVETILSFKLDYEVSGLELPYFFGGVWSDMGQAISPSRKIKICPLEDISYYPPREKLLEEKLHIVKPDTISSKLFQISTKLSYGIVIVSMIWGIIISMSNPLAIMFFILAGFFCLWFLIALDEWSNK